MTIEVDLKEIKSLLSEVNSKLDSLLEEKDTCALMALEEKSLKDFLEGEPDVYSVKDVKAVFTGTAYSGRAGSVANCSQLIYVGQIYFAGHNQNLIGQEFRQQVKSL